MLVSADISYLGAAILQHELLRDPLQKVAVFITVDAAC